MEEISNVFPIKHFCILTHKRDSTLHVGGDCLPQVLSHITPQMRIFFLSTWKGFCLYKESFPYSLLYRNLLALCQCLFSSSPKGSMPHGDFSTLKWKQGLSYHVFCSVFCSVHGGNGVQQRMCWGKMLMWAWYLTCHCALLLVICPFWLNWKHEACLISPVPSSPGWLVR